MMGSESSQDVGRPVVVVAGRPNVGKSTLVNRIVGRRVAIVEEKPGVTRDRLFLDADWAGRDFTIADTGGILEGGNSLDKKVSKQATRAVADADLVLFVADAAVGLTDEDQMVATMLRRRARKVLVVANKVDSEHREADAWELAGLGLGEPLMVSALHGRGVGDLLDALVAALPPEEEEAGGSVAEDLVGSSEQAGAEMAAGTAGSRLPAGWKMPAVAIVGRPNVGKSTLFNRLCGEERSVVHDVPGTTRDAIDTVIEAPEGQIRLIDTAGMRRKSRIGEGSEYYSFVRSLAAVDRADVSILVIDSTDGVTHQEQRLAERIDAAGSPIVLALNKWEMVDTKRRLELAAEVEDRLGFLKYAPVLRISAMTGLGVHKLLPAIDKAMEAYHRRIPTGRLNDAVRKAQMAHSAPGARILYAVQGGIDPPTVTVFATRRLSPQYLRYLERSLREQFDLGPSPLEIRVRVRGGR